MNKKWMILSLLLLNVSGILYGAAAEEISQTKKTVRFTETNDYQDLNETIHAIRHLKVLLITHRIA